MEARTDSSIVVDVTTQRKLYHKATVGKSEKHLTYAIRLPNAKDSGT